MATTTTAWALSSVSPCSARRPLMISTTPCPVRDVPAADGRGRRRSVATDTGKAPHVLHQHHPPSLIAEVVGQVDAMHPQLDPNGYDSPLAGLRTLRLDRSTSFSHGIRPHPSRTDLAPPCPSCSPTQAPQNSNHPLPPNTPHPQRARSEMP